MSEIDGVDIIAFHHHFPPESPDAPFRGVDYRRNYELAWEQMQRARLSLEAHLACILLSPKFINFLFLIIT